MDSMKSSLNSSSDSNVRDDDSRIYQNSESEVRKWELNQLGEPSLIFLSSGYMINSTISVQAHLIGELPEIFLILIQSI